MLYKLIREADRVRQQETPILETTPDELQNQLNPPSSYTIGRFNQKVLSPPIEKINLKN